MTRMMKSLKSLRNESKITKLLSEHHNKKYNLINNGIAEEKCFSEHGFAVWESNIDTADSVRDFFADVLQVDKTRRWNYVNIHRIGMPKAGKPRAIIVRFSEMLHKDSVMQNLYRLKSHNKIEGGSRIYANEQLPNRMAKQR